jgi:hypothetical protein
VKKKLENKGITIADDSYCEPFNQMIRDYLTRRETKTTQAKLEAISCPGIDMTNPNTRERVAKNFDLLADWADKLNSSSEFEALKFNSSSLGTVECTEIINRMARQLPESSYVPVSRADMVTCSTSSMALLKDLANMKSAKGVTLEDACKQYFTKKVTKEKLANDTGFDYEVLEKDYCGQLGTLSDEIQCIRGIDPTKCPPPEVKSKGAGRNGGTPTVTWQDCESKDPPQSLSCSSDGCKCITVSTTAPTGTPVEHFASLDPLPSATYAQKLHVVSIIERTTFLSAAEKSCEETYNSEQAYKYMTQTERNQKIYECELAAQEKRNRTSKTVSIIGSSIGTAGAAVSTGVTIAVLAKIDDVISSINGCRGSF